MPAYDGFWTSTNSTPVRIIRQFRHGDSCSCIDYVYGTPDPSCPICNGTGKAMVAGITVVPAAIYRDGEDRIRDDDEDGASLHAFFPVNSGIADGCVVIYEDRQYVVTRSVASSSHIECALEVKR